jgi:hypothetical protein
MVPSGLVKTSFRICSSRTPIPVARLLTGNVASPFSAVASPHSKALGRDAGPRRIFLNGKADRTPEEMFALAEIMSRCGKTPMTLSFNYRPMLGGGRCHERGRAKKIARLCCGCASSSPTCFKQMHPACLNPVTRQARQDVSCDE